MHLQNAYWLLVNIMNVELWMRVGIIQLEATNKTWPTENCLITEMNNEIEL